MKKRDEPQMLRANIKPKKAMEIFDKTFKSMNQHPPYMRAYDANPTPAFMVDSYAKVAHWSKSAMRGLLTTLTRVEPAPDISGMIGQTKRLLHEVMGDEDLVKKDGRTHFGRWREWPHIRVTPDKIVDSTRSKELTEEERVKMVTKQAVKKKVGVEKRSVKVAKVKASAVTATTKLRVIKDSKRPKNDERARVKTGIVGIMSAEAIVKRLDCKLKTLDIMLRHGYVEVVK